MTEFTASNGLKIKANENEHHPVIVASLGLLPTSVIALREFFQHERDEELGRWRWPENPNYVVYLRNDGQAGVFNEATGVTVYRFRGEHEHIEELRRQSGEEVMPHTHAARAYFEAHPERKPWEDATYKDVWVWTTEDNTQEALGWVAGDGTWDIITPKGDGIKAAERPVSALVEAGFEKFRGEVSGVKRIPEDAS